MKKTILSVLLVVFIAMVMSVGTLCASQNEYIIQDFSDEWYNELTKESTDTVIVVLDPDGARHWRWEQSRKDAMKKIEILPAPNKSLGTRIFTVTFNPLSGATLRNYWGPNMDDVYKGITWPSSLTVDMSQYDGISFWFKGANTKAGINISLFEEKGERWVLHPRGDIWLASFVDDSTEWKEIYVPFKDLNQSLTNVAAGELNNEMDFPFSGIRWTIRASETVYTDVTYSFANIRLVKKAQ